MPKSVSETQLGGIPSSGTHTSGMLANGVRARIVIPARLASTRLAEKLLLAETGQPLIAHTYQAACKSRLAQGVTLAVDDLRLAQVAQQIRADWVMTDPLAASGTDRIAEVARSCPDIDIFVNVQGDEPEISGESIDKLIELLAQEPRAMIATLATELQSRKDIEDPSCVKVVCSHDSMALYFSRSMIPYPRDISDLSGAYLQHLGIYAYRREFLLALDKLPASPLERIEKLEQLRFLQAGYPIVVGIVSHAARGIDTRDDYDAFLARHRKLKS
ncbi:MAG: 3-deoxy-manno-octulosonate cytidylyltransferase [Planctomycetaceae bacterium]|jgi:3-deoxy-manno-octulosonate cytidylyltransferase (CMP-KDO synthetase)|nr:3-deoxy-manno-octulosonate cytidylyltransferase [Planctomycetaceae bacterium]